MTGIVRLGDKSTGHSGYPSRPNIQASDDVLANKKGVTATPTFFLNGEKVDSETVDDLLAADGGSKLADMLDAKIRENGGTPPARNN